MVKDKDENSQIILKVNIGQSTNDFFIDACIDDSYSRRFDAGYKRKFAVGQAHESTPTPDFGPVTHCDLIRRYNTFILAD